LPFAEVMLPHLAPLLDRVNWTSLHGSIGVMGSFGPSGAFEWRLMKIQA
jgi:hypothetical protein